MRRWCAAAVVLLAAVAGCAAPYDDDGEGPALMASAAAPPPFHDATPVVVDTDLGGDDLVALAFLLRQRSVDVRAVTIAATGLVGCEPGVGVVRGVFAALRHAPVPIACGRSTAGPGARRFPKAWRQQAETGTGIRPVAGAALPEAADELIADVARDTHGLVVLALGPLTNVADLLASHPGLYARLAEVRAMSGSVTGSQEGGVVEWNAAADPESLAAVLAAPAPLTVVPEDAVPTGTPAALHAPVVGAVAAAIHYPKWWDLTTAASLVVLSTGRVESGRWVSDAAAPGRLRRVGPGPVRVYRSFDRSRLESAFEEAFAALDR